MYRSTRRPFADFFLPDDFAPNLKGRWSDIQDQAELIHAYNPRTSLWARKDVLFDDSRGDRFRALIPTLQLATNIIIHFTEAYDVCLDEEYLRSACEIDRTYQEDLMDFIKDHLPVLALDPDTTNVDSCARATLAADPESGERNVVTLQYPLLRPLLSFSESFTYHEKVMASFYVATLIVRELEHILQCRGSSESYWKYARASSSVESRLFGGRFHPIYHPKWDEAPMKELRAVAMSSKQWGTHYMEVDPKFLESLLLPETWESSILPSLSPPRQKMVRSTILIMEFPTWKAVRAVVEEKRRQQASRARYEARKQQEKEEKERNASSTPAGLETWWTKFRRFLRFI
ncbi:hypothetical protein TWF696_009657 [Orbilia brochopaga]|uniref:Uncharacterized protein n=1 Tax=Orbilia brochopaga TaxID=3140254 RepID=A0AAV9UES2_9PEZI